jgi:hypothetical protein
MGKQRKVTDQEIEDALDLVAELIDKYGDVYWPVFERLERELAERRSRRERLKARLNKATKQPKE